MAPPARTPDFSFGTFQATIVQTPNAASVLCVRGSEVLGQTLLPRNLTRSEIRACLETKGNLAESEICALLNWLSPETASFSLE